MPSVGRASVIATERKSQLTRHQSPFKGLGSARSTVDLLEKAPRRTLAGSISLSVLPKRSEPSKNLALSHSVASLQSHNRSHIQHKLSYEWKNIYRHLHQFPNKGLVSTDLFNKACTTHGVMLTSEEVQKLQGPDGRINYLQISKDLGLHTHRLDRLSS